MDYGSVKFQWLPTDFQVNGKGDVKALGYINNLHPSHEGLFKCIEDVIKYFIPLWERVLTDMVHDLPMRIPGPYLPIEQVDPNYPKEKQNKRKGGVEGVEDDDEEENYWELVEDYMDNVWSDNKIVGLPDVPEEGYSGGLEMRNQYISLGGKKLQIIVKLANIHLVRAL